MAEQAEPKIQYTDRPELDETFVDSVRQVTFDGATIRAELCVTRAEQTARGAALSMRRYPAARLVIRPDAAVDLFIRLQQLIAHMEKQGIIKRQEPGVQAAAPGAEALQKPVGKPN
ncbi:MAG TPA: hypothetical protein VED01_06065 [Burkholderiales bacterium]|nr:hypothetical protein [Burkholderiales bacterium]